MRRTLLFFILFISSFSFAQQARVEGRVMDKRGVPVDGVKVYSEKANPTIVYTDDNGVYELFYDTLGTFTIHFVLSELKEVRTVEIIELTSQKIADIKLNFQQESGGVVTYQKEDPFGPLTLEPIDFGTLPTLGGVEHFLKFTTAATSNNELTSSYNVRGGSYDENLVYVNGFKIYRPFLTRSGQQEGMSFIHTSLVKSLSFSAGGFNSEYGDKLSSVLDIQYKTPDSTSGSAMLSLLGVESHFEAAPSNRFNYLVGARFRSNGYLLNSLPTKGAYNPVFWDAQFVTNYKLTENVTWSVLGHFSLNNYRFSPQTQETDFGTANEAYSFVIYFDGSEETRFRTLTGGTSVKWAVDKNTNLDFYATVFNTDEREYFDIQGEYFINELETDPSKEEFGDSIAVLGVGSFLNHARNRLQATIFNLYHNGDHVFQKGYIDDDRLNFRNHILKWGVNFQLDDFYDNLSEWKMIDSAGYSLPQQPSSEIQLLETVKGQLELRAQRYTSFVQWNSIYSKIERDKIVTVSKKFKKSDGTKYKEYYTDTIRESASKFALTIGTRGGYTSANQEFYITPRAALRYYPRKYMVKDSSVVRRGMSIKLATGMYYQPPFYREYRTFEGDLNLDVRAQKSAHFVLGTDVLFNMWDREVPFKFTAEAYYKYMWDVNPYEVDNVRTRYYANNDAVAYAYGLDLNLHGEFVEGIESFFKVGFLSTKEDVLTDFYYDYYNASGEKIDFEVIDKTVTDSVRIEPGFIPRPTDQLFTFAALIQDRMPFHEKFSVQMGLQFGSRLPYGPPDKERYKDTLRMKSYFRVDIGFSYDFLYGEQKNETFWSRNFTDAIISFEIFNLLGINNVLSKQWIQDVEGKYYSIPNYLTQRRLNLKLILRF